MSTSQFAIATHALAVLAHDGGGAPIEALAEAVNTDPSFLRSVMVALERAQLVEARGGHGGGFHLVRSAGSITLQQVHDALEPEGPSSPVGSKASMRLTLEAVLAQPAHGDFGAGLARFTVEDVARTAFGGRPVPYLDARAFQTQVLDAKRPVLVEFSASWCSPCRALAPILDELAAKSAGRYDVVKVDIDDVREIAERYAIRGVPTVIAFVGGKPAAQHVGMTDAATLLGLLPDLAR